MKPRRPKFIWQLWIWSSVVAFLALGVCVGILALAFVLAGEIYDYQDTVDGVHLPDVDVIVCLAGGRGRIAAAGDLWYRYHEHDPEHAPVLFISGVGHGITWNSFSKQLRRGVLANLPEADVVLEKESTNTDENARFFVKWARDKGWRRVLLMTSPYHMKRARFMFESEMKWAGLGASIETLSIFQEPFEPGEWRSNLLGIRVTIEEYLKWVYYRVFWK